LVNKSVGWVGGWLAFGWIDKRRDGWVGGFIKGMAEWIKRG